MNVISNLDSPTSSVVTNCGRTRWQKPTNISTECMKNRDEGINFVEDHRMTNQSCNGVKVELRIYVSWLSLKTHYCGIRGSRYPSGPINLSMDTDPATGS